jgi:hypothetical protein
MLPSISNNTASTSSYVEMLPQSYGAVQNITDSFSVRGIINKLKKTKQEVVMSGHDEMVKSKEEILNGIF